MCAGRWPDEANLWGFLLKASWHKHEAAPPSRPATFKLFILFSWNQAGSFVSHNEWSCRAGSPFTSHLPRDARTIRHLQPAEENQSRCRGMINSGSSLLLSITSFDISTLFHHGWDEPETLEVLFFGLSHTCMSVFVPLRSNKSNSKSTRLVSLWSIRTSPW